jgi:type IV secretion system protein VirB4
LAEAYIGSLLGHGQPNLRRPLLSSKNLVDLLPLTSLWPGEEANPSNFSGCKPRPRTDQAAGGLQPAVCGLPSSHPSGTM